MTLIIDSGYTQWDPASITTALWLDAADETTLFTTDSGSTLATNGTTVGRWVDKSGNSRNAAQSTPGLRPTYTTSAFNGKNVLTFPGSTYRALNISSLPLQDTVTIIAVFENAVQFGSGSIHKPVLGCTSTDVNVSNSTGYTFGKSVSSDAGARMSVPSDEPNTTNVSTSYAAAGGTYEIVAGTNAAGSVSLLRNGVVAASDTVTNRTSGWVTGYSIGYSFGGTLADSRFYTGNLCEIIALTASPLLATTQRLEGYLAHKWGLTANLPSDHPYKTVGPTP